MVIKITLALALALILILIIQEVQGLRSLPPFFSFGIIILLNQPITSHLSFSYGTGKKPEIQNFIKIYP